MTLTVLFCADPLDPRRVDPHFGRESEAVRDHYGTFSLIDHDALLAGDAAAAVRRVPADLGAAWYRGWMVDADQYATLHAALRKRGVRLFTDPDDYRRAHELPGWHEAFAGLTPRSVWCPVRPGAVVPEPAELAELVRPLAAGPAVVKDYVKSRKHEWLEACFVPDLSDTDRLRTVAQRMVDLQEDFLTGGVVVREYEAYVTGEARVWWIDGEPAVIGPHPDDPGVEPVPDLTAVGPAVRALGCRFITTDLARCDDGRWRVVEVGDGQVSDLPITVDPIDLYSQLPMPG